MISEDDLIEALAEELSGDTVQEGDIILSDFITKTGKSWTVCQRFLAARPDLREIKKLYSPKHGKRVTVFRPCKE